MRTTLICVLAATFAVRSVDAKPPTKNGYASSVPALGPAVAPVVVAAWIDMQCPFSARRYATLESVQRRFGGKLRVEFHAFPLEFHDRAEPSAVAVLAAHKQGKFAAMASRIFGDRNQSAEHVRDHAKALGLNIAMFDRDLASRALLRDVRMDAAAGEAIGVNGTPTAFLNGRLLEGGDEDEIVAAVDAELVEIAKLTAAGASLTTALRARIAATDPLGVFLALVVDRSAVPVSLEPKKPYDPEPEPIDATVHAIHVLDGAPMRGPADAPVTIVACQDFQCPFCAKVAPTIDAVVAAHAADVRLVWFDRPLEFHQHAAAAAAAARAAHAQGKFWEMRDRLLGGQQNLAVTDLMAHAQALGLDMARFASDLNSPPVAAAIAETNARCERNGALGTPFFFVNGRAISGARPQSAFDALIDEELAKARAEITKGTSRAGIYEHMLALGLPTRSRLDPTVYALDVAGAPTLGPNDARITIVVFADFECPYCARLGAWLLDVPKRLPGTRIVYQHFPVDYHPHARRAALAAAAAHHQDRFWELARLLHEHSQELDDGSLERWAHEAGLDVDRWKRDVLAPAAAATVGADAHRAKQANVIGTPTVFINGRRLKVALSDIGSLVELIAEELVDH